jgi:ABC-type bacteriocin/lantibiotic exporter with double-glycine peptidase domain
MEAIDQWIQSHLVLAVIFVFAFCFILIWILAKRHLRKAKQLGMTMEEYAQKHSPNRRRGYFRQE